MAEKRINQFIKVPEVRLIGADGEQVGVVETRAAMDRARELGMDLVEISPTAVPPVCRIMDFGKFRFEEEKKLKEARKKQKVIHIKEVKFRPKIDDHDFEFKVKNVVKFLERGDKVKITVRFRGREMAHAELGFKVIDHVKEFVGQHVSWADEKPAALEGRNIIMVLVPGKKALRKPVVPGAPPEPGDGAADETVTAAPAAAPAAAPVAPAPAAPAAPAANA